MGTRISAQVRSHAQKMLSDYSIANRIPKAQSDQNLGPSVENVSSKKSSKECNSNEISKAFSHHDFAEPSSQPIGLPSSLGKRNRQPTNESI